ncbi:hypothetical protein ACWCQZ_16230 [Streptomyces sp. NPDC002285]|uniref:hypothetical protein n=1 Tax=Streptomyces sp. NPDC056462 TaxID=3345826 RepID=UPI0036C4F58D
MSSGDIAIIIASVSALFTGANMAVSYLTYRRIRPRVTVKTEWRPVWIPDEGFKSDVVDPKRGSLRCCYHVHLINRSPTAVHIDYLDEEYRYPYSRKRWSSRPIRAGRGNIGFRFIEGQEKQEIAPFGGVWWIIQKTTVYLFPPPRGTKVRIKIILTNGTQVGGRWMKYAELEAMREKWDNVDVSPLEFPAFRQLTFSDLEEEE